MTSAQEGETKCHVQQPTTPSIPRLLLLLPRKEMNLFFSLIFKTDFHEIPGKQHAWIRL